MTPRPEVVAGSGVLERLPDRLTAMGAERLLLITGPSRRFVEPVERLLAGFALAIFDEARVHVPDATVDRATVALAEAGADTLVTVGGGAATGLAKVLRLEHAVRFVAVPTTYSGSEMTRVWGRTDGQTKHTGRDARVRPDLVVYDTSLTIGLPLALTVQSLLNALAHPISAMSTGSLRGDSAEEAVRAIGDLVGALRSLLDDPRDPDARLSALCGASRAASAIDAGRMGVHHAVAHVLGGRFDAPHAATHSILLPHFVHDLRTRAPEVHAVVREASGESDPEGALFDLLHRSGAPTALEALSIPLGPARDAVRERERAESALSWLEDAWAGRRPAQS